MVNLLKNIYNILTSPEFRFFHNVSDKIWMQKAWKFKTGKSIDFAHPKGFNEKLQWLKLYDHNPLVDKAMAGD